LRRSLSLLLRRKLLRTLAQPVFIIFLGFSFRLLLFFVPGKTGMGIFKDNDSHFDLVKEVDRLGVIFIARFFLKKKVSPSAQIQKSVVFWRFILGIF